MNLNKNHNLIEKNGKEKRDLVRVAWNASPIYMRHVLTYWLSVYIKIPINKHVIIYF